VSLIASKTHKVILIFGDLILCLFVAGEMEEYMLQGKILISKDRDGALIYTRNLFGLPLFRNIGLSNELPPDEFVRYVAMDIVHSKI
jgi:hypothetical protein